jgi:hypothetical protein
MKLEQRVFLAIAAWFAAVLALGSADAFSGAPGAPPIAILIGFTLPLAAFAAAWAGSEAFRAFVLAADLRLLAGLQAWRFGGLWFLALYANGVLPGLFSFPAGLGDMAVAAAAPWVALRLARDPSFAASGRFVSWNLLGILDLAVAVTLGALCSGIIPALAAPVSSAPMARMPLVLIPAFFVPLLIMVHVTSLLQARRARTGAHSYALA